MMASAQPTAVSRAGGNLDELAASAAADIIRILAQHEPADLARAGHNPGWHALANRFETFLHALATGASAQQAADCTAAMIGGVYLGGAEAARHFARSTHVAPGFALTDCMGAALLRAAKLFPPELLNAAHTGFCYGANLAAHRQSARIGENQAERARRALSVLQTMPPPAVKMG